MIRVVDKKFILREVERPKVKDSKQLLVLLDDDKDRCNYGEIVACAEEYESLIGDIAIFGKHVGDDFKVNNDPYVSLEQHQILAVIDQEDFYG